jgi:hypothetical protein
MAVYRCGDSVLLATHCEAAGSGNLAIEDPKDKEDVISAELGKQEVIRPPTVPHLAVVIPVKRGFR